MMIIKLLAFIGSLVVIGLLVYALASIVKKMISPPPPNNMSSDHNTQTLVNTYEGIHK